MNFVIDHEIKDHLLGMNTSLTQSDFDNSPNGIIRAQIQYCEIFGSKIVWDDPEDAELTWKEDCNMAGEPGIYTGDGGHGYAGVDYCQEVVVWRLVPSWKENTQSSTVVLYTRYTGGQNEHGMRILRLLQ